jgi:hypothetical protein
MYREVYSLPSNTFFQYRMRQLSHTSSNDSLQVSSMEYCVEILGLGQVSFPPPFTPDVEVLDNAIHSSYQPAEPCLLLTFQGN